MRPTSAHASLAVAASRDGVGACAAGRRCNNRNNNASLPQAGD